MIRRFLGAVQFLTVVPVRTATAPPGASAVFFPLIGALIGASGGLLLDAARGYLPFALVSLVVLAFWALITGGLHEDGFADVADAFRAYRAPEKILAILKDSRVGAHGALALMFLLVVRWQALSSIGIAAVPALAAALGIGRAAVVALMWLTPPAGSGSAMVMARSLRSSDAILAVGQGIALAIWVGGPTASYLLGGTTLLVMLARGYFMRRIGGVTGDCLGATEQVVETWCLIVYTCRPCTL